MTLSRFQFWKADNGGDTASTGQVEALVASRGWSVGLVKSRPNDNCQKHYRLPGALRAGRLTAASLPGDSRDSGQTISKDPLGGVGICQGECSGSEVR